MNTCWRGSQCSNAKPWPWISLSNIGDRLPKEAFSMRAGDFSCISRKEPYWSAWQVPHTE